MIPMCLYCAPPARREMTNLSARGRGACCYRFRTIGITREVINKATNRRKKKRENNRRTESGKRNGTKRKNVINTRKSICNSIVLSIGLSLLFTA